MLPLLLVGLLPGSVVSIPRNDMCDCRQSNGMEYAIVQHPDAPNGAGFKTDSENFWYPADYGTAICNAWDEFVHPGCADAQGKPMKDPPIWCKQKWCYVKPACKASDLQVTDLFWNSSTVELFFSYEVCGSKDWYTPSAYPATFSTVATLNRQAVQVIVSKDEPEPGFCADLMELVRQHIVRRTRKRDSSPYANLTFQIKIEKDKWLAEEDLGKFEKDEHAFQVGHYHIGCLKTALPSNVLSAMGVEFSQPVIPASYSLITTWAALQPKALGWMSWSEPFHFDLWLGILIVFIFLSMMLLLLDCVGVASVLNDNEQGANIFVRAIDAAFLTFSAMIGQPMHGGGWAARTFPARMLYLATAICGIFLIATYTANLTTFLQAQQQERAPPSFARLSNPQVKVCDGYAGAGRHVRELLESRHEGAKHATVVSGPEGPYDCFGEAYKTQTCKYYQPDQSKYKGSRFPVWQIEMLHENQCDVILYSRIHAHWLLYNKQPSPDCVMVEADFGYQTQNYALAMRKQEWRLRELVDNALLSLRKDGKIDALYNSYWRSRFCTAEETATKEEEAKQLQVDAYSGILVFIGAFAGCTVLSLIGSVARTLYLRRKENPEPDDGNISRHSSRPDVSTVPSFLFPDLASRNSKRASQSV